MESIGVLMALPMNNYLERELEKRYNLMKLWTVPHQAQYIKDNAERIRAVVGNSFAGADAELIDALPRLEIVASFSVGLDRVDLSKCRERGIRVTNTPDVLTDDAADIAIGLMLAVLRRLCESDRYVRAGRWKAGDYKLTTKFSGKTVGMIGQAVAKSGQAFNCPIIYNDISENQIFKYKYHPTAFWWLPVNSRKKPRSSRCFVPKRRPDHVDELELVSALVEGRIGGAGNAPHRGSGTVETRQAMANLEAHFLKKPLLTPVV